MFLYPKDIKDNLEFNQFIDHISAECLSDMGRRIVEKREKLVENTDDVSMKIVVARV